MSTSDLPISRRGLIAGAGAVGAAGALVSGAGASAYAAVRPAHAARVILNGRVFTGAGGGRGLEAVAIADDGTIVEVGTTREIRRRMSRRTEVIDADGGTIMAGIHDGHMHPLGAAKQSLNPSLDNASMTVPELQAVLQGFLDATDDQEPDGWLDVTDWSPVGLLPAGTVADKQMLDALDTARPIRLQGSDFHNSWVNSRALALAGIDRNTPDPAGGEIVRGPDGVPTGLLKDNAQWLVGAVIPPPDEERLQRAYADVAAYMLSLGITSFLDAVAGEESLQSYAALRSSGLLRQQVTPALALSAELTAAPAEAAAYLADLRSRYAGRAGLHLTTVKVFVDGAIEYPAQTAALLEPYLDGDGKPTDNYGDLYISRAEYRRLAVVLDKAGWQLHSHAIGDRAVRVALDAYQAARRANGARSRANRHTIAHLQLVHPSDYPRFAKLGVLACMQLQWAVRNEWTLDALRPFIGEERFRRLYPANSLRKAGARLAGGSDWPVDSLMPFNQIATAIDRTDARFGEPEALLRKEGITRSQSLAMHTSGSAFQLKEARRGTVTPGAVADLVVVDRDLQAAGPRRIRAASIRNTLIRGEVVYDADSAEAKRIARRTAVAGIAGRRAPHSDCCGG